MIQNKYIIRLSFLCVFITIIASIFLYRYFIIQTIGLNTLGNFNEKIVTGYKTYILEKNKTILEKLQTKKYNQLVLDPQFIAFIQESQNYFNNMGVIVNFYGVNGNKLSVTPSNKNLLDIKQVNNFLNEGIYYNLWARADKYFLNNLMKKNIAFRKTIKFLTQHNIIIPKNIITNNQICEEASFIISYIPIINGTILVGVIEIYADFTKQWQNIEDITKEVLISFLCIFFIFLIIIIRNTKFAQKIINEQFATNRALKDAKIRAETENTAKTEFLANVSHELRTPLNAIIGFSEMMINEKYCRISSTQYQEYIQDINNSGKHLLSVINDILDFSKASIDKLKVEHLELDLNKLITSSMRFIKPRAEKAKIYLIEKLPPETIIIKADPKRLKQALLNLLANSVKFTQENGSITLQIEKDLIESVINIYVIDTGIGMNEQDIPNALSSFGQIDNRLNRKYEGTGLGLPLTKKLIELMQGKFKLQSKIGKGTIVTLTFQYNESSDI